MIVKKSEGFSLNFFLKLTTLARRFNFNRYTGPKLSLPGKIVFPR